MKKLSLLITLLLISISCVKKGDESLSATGKIEDITINLLKVTPATVVIAPSTQTQFAAVGGNPPYSYAVDSGLGTIDSTGLYTAPASTGNFTIKTTDISGNNAYALVVVGNSLQISPSSKTMGTSKNLTFSAIGGVAPYTYSIVSGLGTINASTGVFTSAATVGLTTVQLKDQNNDTAFASITVVNALTLTPLSVTMEDLTVQAFSTAGGSPPYTYQVYAGLGSIDASGNYTAPATESNNIVRVTDNDGNYEEATIAVKFGPSAQITRSVLPPSTNTTVSSTQGTAPFAYSILSGAGSVNPTTGIFTSPAQAASTVIRITDANSFVSDIAATTFNYKKMAIGEQHSCYTELQSDNTTSVTKCWGRQNNGVANQGKAYIGDEASEMGANLTPSDLGTGLVPNAIYMGQYYHSCVSFTNNKIKCFGNGQYGKTGLGNQSHYGYLEESMGDNLNYINLGTDVNTTIDVKDRAVLSGYHSCVLTTSGSAKCFGHGGNGRLGYGSTQSKCDHPSRCGTALAELEHDPGESIKKMALGLEYSCALIAPTNKVKCWGRNTYGQLGTGNNTDLVQKPKDISFIDLGAATVTDISSGNYHVCAVLSDNTIKCWGRDYAGTLARGTSNQHQGDGGGEMGASLATIDLGSVSFPVKVFSKSYSNCAIFNNGAVKCWGYNGYGMLGLGGGGHKGDAGGEMGDSLAFVDLGTGRTATHLSMSERNVCATLDNGQLKCWGHNGYGQLGQGHTTQLGDGPGEMGDSLAAIDLNSNVIMSASTRYGNCALTADNKVKCFGYSETGSFGIGSESYGDKSSETISSLASLSLGTGFNVKTMYSGRFNACVIGTNNETKCIGYNAGGALGSATGTGSMGRRLDQIGDNLNLTDLGTGLYPKKITLGHSHGCAILDNDRLKCWGDGNVGATGLDTTADKGDGAGEMGDNLNFVDVGTVKDVDAGYLATCTVLTSGQLKCFGYNNYGQLGVGNNTNRAYHTGANALNNYGFTDMGTGRTAKQISAGYNHFCALLDNDTVKCWGRDYAGQLGLETNNNHRGNGAGEMGDNLPVVNLGSGLTPVKIDSGIYHNCALFDNGKVKCWGLNSSGQLGVGDTGHRGDAASEMGDNLPFVILPTNDKIVDIEVGGYSTCVLTDKNEMKCFGYNPYGNLGQGHRYNVGTDGLSMGDNLPKVQ